METTEIVLEDACDLQIMVRSFLIRRNQFQQAASRNRHRETKQK